MATVKEAFTCQYQLNKNVGIEEVTFATGDEVTVIKEWSGDTCLIKNADGIVFNAPKKNLNL